MWAIRFSFFILLLLGVGNINTIYGQNDNNSSSTGDAAGTFPKVGLGAGTFRIQDYSDNQCTNKTVDGLSDVFRSGDCMPMPYLPGKSFKLACTKTDNNMHWSGALYNSNDCIDDTATVFTGPTESCTSQFSSLQPPGVKALSIICYEAGNAFNAFNTINLIMLLFVAVASSIVAKSTL